MMPARSLRDTVGEQRGRWDLPRGAALCRHLTPLVDAAKAFFDARNSFTLDIDCHHCGIGFTIGEDHGLMIVSRQDGYWERRTRNGAWSRHHA